MGCYLSTSCFARNFVADAIRWCHEITPYRVEISAPHRHQSLEYLEGTLGEFKESGYSLTLHNYFPAPKESFVLNMAAADEPSKTRSTALVRGALRLAVAAGAPLYGIHAGYLARADAQANGMFRFDDVMSPYAEALDRAVVFVNEIAPEFEAQGVRLLVENLFPSPKKRHSLFCSIDEVREFMDQVPDSVGLLLDLGHLNVSSRILEFDRDTFIDDYLGTFAGRLVEVHISENEGQKDEHLPVKPGSWQLDAVRRVHQTGTTCSTPRIYCIEARNASVEELRKSVALIDDIIV